MGSWFEKPYHVGCWHNTLMFTSKLEVKMWCFMMFCVQMWCGNSGLSRLAYWKSTKIHVVYTIHPSLIPFLNVCSYSYFFWYKLHASDFGLNLAGRCKTGSQFTQMSILSVHKYTYTAAFIFHAIRKCLYSP